MTVSAADIADWQQAIGRRRVQRQLLDVESLRRFAVASGADADVERTMPALGHWAWFLEARPDDGIGPDGHPKRGDFLPAVTLPRRMFAASAIDFHAPLDLGAEAELESVIVDVRHRSGASGDLVFVEVERRLRQSGVERIRERQTIAYRGQGDPVPLPEPGAGFDDGELWTPDAVQLFRFSAATFNSHRIHYDLPYARGVEGYPDLVVQGPLTAARLSDLAAREGALARVAFRLLAPLFAGQAVRLGRGPEGDFQAVRCDGAAAVSLKADYR